MELISLQLTWLASLGGRQNKQSGLSPAERERIHAARELLVRDMASPPPLSELSQRLCLSINKLEAGFQELFGMTVFGYLREYKMQKARHFFEEAEMNVSQVAWAVGYVNVSHFSAAYKKRFGILPKAYLRTARRKIIPA
ncbi:helix-turn-helix transcriptional regulator [Desulfonema ishimotonii]|uniref:helix-turn-helix transcriptional regulator n=1 Tax=Desulfonema ishimotonii TaxID=45657 RepID=UPI0014081560|nr:AraC family transcriptional regulator [Desulfonema ishimotonii]